MQFLRCLAQTIMHFNISAVPLPGFQVCSKTCMIHALSRNCRWRCLATTTSSLCWCRQCWSSWATSRCGLLMHEVCICRLCLILHLWPVLSSPSVCPMRKYPKGTGMEFKVSCVFHLTHHIVTEGRMDSTEAMHLCEQKQKCPCFVQYSKWCLKCSFKVFIAALIWRYAWFVGNAGEGWSLQLDGRAAQKGVYSAVVQLTIFNDSFWTFCLALSGIIIISCFVHGSVNLLSLVLRFTLWFLQLKSEMLTFSKINVFCSFLYDIQTKMMFGTSSPAFRNTAISSTASLIRGWCTGVVSAHPAASSCARAWHYTLHEGQVAAVMPKLVWQLVEPTNKTKLCVGLKPGLASINMLASLK